MGDKCNCYRFSPRDSLSGAVAQIADYLSKHPGWNETELRAFVDGLISATGVESFNGRTGTVTLDKNDVNNLKIASAYFAEGDESIDSLDLVSLYNQGVRFVFTDFNSVTHGYNLAFALEYFSGSGNVVYYPMTAATGSGNIVSVNGKTGVVQLKVVDVSNGNSQDENAYIFIDESDDYPEVTSPDSNKLGGQLPSYYASAEDVSKLKNDIAPLIYNNAGAHNAVYRGKNLGSVVTDEQWAQIGAGTFGDLFIGDYWVINGVTWRIAAFDYWYRFGDSECTTHHAVIVPDSNLPLNADGSTTHWMNATNTTSGAYVGSDFYTGNNGNTGKAQCRSMAQSAFGSAHILTHREYLQNAVVNGYESSGAWYDSDIEVMNEKMVYGCSIFGNQSAGTNIPSAYTIDNAQLTLFVLDHSKICNRADWLLRDVVSASHFAFVSTNGDASYLEASAPWVGVRPAFGIRA